MAKPSSHIETKDWQELDDLLQLLKEDYLLTDLTLYPQILTIAERSKTPRDMRFRLAALLCQNEVQQDRFYALFDSVFPEVIQVELVQPELSEADITFKIDKTSVDTSSQKAGSKRQEKKKVSAKAAKKEKTQSWINEATSTFAAILAFSALLIYMLNRDMITHWTGYVAYIMAVIFVGYILRQFFRRSKPTPILELGQDGTPEQFRNLHLPDYQLVQFGRGFKKLSTQLRERELSETPILDINNTVRKTIRAGGIFQPQYRFKTEPPSYLVLIDYTIPNNHRTRIAEMLHRWLKEQMVPVSRFYYRNTPRHCWNENNPKGLPLQKLAQTYAKERLLVFGDGWAFLHPLEAGLAKWAHTLLNWEERAIVTPINPRQWSQREVFLNQYFQLVPASEDGLQVVNDFYKTKGQIKAEEHIWAGEPVEEIRLEHFEKDLAKTLPEPELREWLAALSCFPKLHWKLTLHLGELISKKSGQDLLQFESLRKLSRLSWFYNGFFPRAVREKLYRSLSEDRKRLVHTAIYKWLQAEGQKEMAESTDQSGFELQLALQKLAAGLSSSAEKKELQKTIAREQYLQITLSDNPEEYDTDVPEALLANLPGVQRRIFWRDMWMKVTVTISRIRERINNSAEDGVQVAKDLFTPFLQWKTLDKKVLEQKAWQFDRFKFYVEQFDSENALKELLKLTDSTNEIQQQFFNSKNRESLSKWQQIHVIPNDFSDAEIKQLRSNFFRFARIWMYEHETQILKVLPSIVDLENEGLVLLETARIKLFRRTMIRRPFFAPEFSDFTQNLNKILTSPYHTSIWGELITAAIKTLINILRSHEPTRLHKKTSEDFESLHLSIERTIGTHQEIRQKNKSENVDLSWQELVPLLYLLEDNLAIIDNPHAIVFYDKEVMRTSTLDPISSTKRVLNEIRKHVANSDLREALAIVISLPELDHNDSYVLAVSEILADLHILETDLTEQQMTSRGRPASPLRAKIGAAILDLVKSIEDNIDENRGSKNAPPPPRLFSKISNHLLNPMKRTIKI